METKATTKPSPVQGEINKIDVAIQTLDKDISQLASRLGPILMPAGPQAENVPKDRALTTCELGEQLCSVCIDLMDRISILESITARIQV